MLVITIIKLFDIYFNLPFNGPTIDITNNNNHSLINLSTEPAEEEIT
jgi:hypothetical protein